MKYNFLSLIFLLCFSLNLKAQQNSFRGNNNYVAPKAASNYVTNGLVLHLDASNTTSYPGTGNTWTDLSGGGNNGTIFNSAGYDSANGGSLLFNGSNSYVNAGNNSSLQLTEGTISAWINAGTSNSGFRGIIAKQLAWSIFVYNNNLITYDWGNGSIRNTSINVGNNSWNHVAMTFTQTIGNPSNNAIIYLNGIAVLTTTVKNSGQTQNVLIGEANAGQFFTGKISQASIYNRVLTAEEILQNFNSLKSRFGL
jgi:hypothetical protein